jgi:gliotoxin/aspirochlorine biosynthesis peptide synthetase
MPGQNIYRTGDLGMWTESMELQFIGRIDNQVKLRGFRIKLEKVDRTILLANAAIRQAAAIVNR